MKKFRESPCTHCQRVADPNQFENKECRLWRNWFTARWDALRQQYLAGEDPCIRCECPRELCFEPCEDKRQWDKEGIQ